ncbi:MAG: hypothetical protein EOO89_28980 [Pedobacter sp.]|nr:MAG: hypothetical protein EOO89_28980 [Pedobacter sp.]
MLIVSRLLLLLYLISFISCRQPENQPDVEATLRQLIKRFPQLPSSSEKLSDYYRLIRSVSLGNSGIELQLRSTPDTLDSVQSIVFITNGNKEIYGVPLLSNEHRSYWNFLFDTKLLSEKSTNTTFQMELQTAIDTLGLNDTLGTASKVIDEMLISLLQCRRIYDGDSTEIHSIRLYSNHNLPEEDSDTCLLRFKKSWKAIVTEMHPKEYLK